MVESQGNCRFVGLGKKFSSGKTFCDVQLASDILAYQARVIKSINLIILSILYKCLAEKELDMTETLWMNDGIYKNRNEGKSAALQSVYLLQQL